jgi:hypothetical protein
MKLILYVWAILIVICLGLTARHAMAQPIVTESTSKSETTVKSPPPSAISPNITTINNIMCTSGVSAAVQTQIFGFSTGTTFIDMNCEKILLSRELSALQMKVPATALLCSDARVWWAMWDGGVPCPVEGKINVDAKNHWLANPNLIPDRPKIK